MTPARLLAGLAVLALAACDASPPPPPSEASAAASLPVSSTLGPSPSAPIALPEPGRPYDADDLLAAMRDSRRPGGVPEELQDPAIAAELADRLWTLDGQPWEGIAAGGSCGPSTCTLELSGGRSDASGDDAWAFRIQPADGTVEVVSADLHAVPDRIAAALDRWARALDPDGLLDGLRVTAVRWLPPPSEDRFRLAYRSGDEEASCSVDLELDVAAGRVTEITPSGC